MDYNKCLQSFKKSLIGGSEKEIIREEIQKNVSTNNIRWLDIGIGNGLYLKKLIGPLEEEGFKFNITGIDASKESIKKAHKTFKDSKIILGKFEEKNISGKFDIINLTQSFYYFKDKKKILKKISSLLAEGGLLVITLWSENDSLYKIYKKFYSEKESDVLNSEKILKLLSELKGFQKIKKRYFVSKVDFKRLKKSLVNLQETAYVISRFPVSHKVKEDLNLKELNEHIQRLNDFEPRVNGVVIAKKSYNILNWNKKSIIKNLEKKFPLRKRLIPKLKGDLESFFMASWEKETDYLSNQFPEGNVLELCCASGLRSIVLAKRHKVIAIDINPKRISFAKENAKLTGTEKKIRFIEGNVLDKELLSNLGNFQAILIDVDWREKLSDPIKKQNISPLKTTPPVDELFKLLKEMFPETPIIFKMSPFCRISEMTKLGNCLIESLNQNGLLCYNVYFGPDVKKTSFTEHELK